MENTILTESEESQLVKVFNLLNTSHRSNQTERINEVQEELLSMNENLLSFIKVLIKGLYITKIRQEEISLDLHKSLLIYLKNYLLINQRYINNCDIYEYYIALFDLFLTVTDNENIQCDSMHMLFDNFIKTLNDNNNTMMEDEEYVDKLLQNVFNKISKVEDRHFLYVVTHGLGLISILLLSKNVGQKNFFEFFKKYLISTADIIFNKVHKYIKQKNNEYNMDFVIILNNLYEKFYKSMEKMKRFYPSLTRKEIADELFAKYGKCTYELIEIMPLCDEKAKNEFGEANPILVFNSDFNEINIMKASAFKFVNLIIQFSTMCSSSTINNNNNCDNDLEHKIYTINNQLLVDISSKLITLSIKSLENILNDGKKFYYLRDIEAEREDEENKYNLLLYEIFLFLCESLTKEPIIGEFNEHIKLFLLNILFPFLTTVESEKNYMILEPEEYCAYFNDLVYNFTLKNFRVCGIYLIKKISEKYLDISNFILSYIIGMFNDILNSNSNNGANANNQINNIIDNLNNDQCIQFNAYYFYKANNVLIDKLNEETKLDFCLIILILLQKKLLEYNTLKNKLRDGLIKAKDKLLNLKGVLIKIKFCHLFKFVIPNLFIEENDDNSSTSDDHNDKDNENDMNKIIENDNSISNKYGNFIEIALNFLFNNLIQVKTKEYLIYETYYHSLGNEASLCIISLFKYIRNENDNKNYLLKNKLIDLLQIYFHALIDLIDIINLYTFFNVIEQIIKYIKINNREDIFKCLDKLTKRFDKEFETGDINSQIYCPLYFNIISSFFTGINKISIDNKNELNLFHNIFKLALDQMNDVFRFIYYENLISSMIEYLKCFKGINEQTSLVLKSICMIIDNDRGFSLSSYNYVRTFLFYLDNNISDGFLSQEKLFDEIINIINKAFTFEDDQHDNSNLYALLLILQILTKNINISDKIYKSLLAQALKCFSYIFKKDEKSGFSKKKKLKNLIILAIFGSGYIFYPERTHNFLDDLDIIEKKEKLGLYEEVKYEKFNFNKYTNLLEYINEYEVENELLRKCLILGFCSIFNFENLKIYLDNNKNIKLKLIKIFSEFILYHKNEEIKKRNKLMKHELKIIKNEDGKTNYQNEEESESEEEEQDKDKSIFDKNLNYIFEANTNIKTSNEYQYFKDTLDYVKQHDFECFNKFCHDLNQLKIKQLEEIYHVKKFKVYYQGKELEIPRRIVNIKRNDN